MNALAKHRPALSGKLADIVCLDRFERRYQALVAPKGARDKVSQAVRHTAQVRGKRVRPLLMMHAAYDLGVAQDDVVDLAVAVELVHTASLVLDDLPCMDNSDMRRGHPTMHREFGEHIAILAAVGLLMRAIEIIAQHPTMRAEQRVQVVDTLSRACGMEGLVKGQLRDLQDGFSSQSSADAQMTNLLKTGVLFDAALQSVATLAGTPAGNALALSRCAREIGLAFQLADDLNDDPLSPVGATGKDTGKDLGKPTVLSLVGATSVREQIRHRMGQADACLASAPARFHSVRGYLRDMMTSYALG